MKFAVVEYTSKTGRVWKHTEEHPNYLADPIKEMDPTSFGCYVSALKGEHIPLTSLITGELSKASFLNTFLKKVYKRITGNWPAYSLDYLAQFDAILVVYQISDGHEITSFVKELKKLSKRPVIIGVPTQPFGILKDYWEKHPEWLADFTEFMNACDSFITIVQSTAKVWQQMTSTPVTYLPQPYPASFAAKHVRKLADKQPIILVAGVTDRYDIKRGQLVAKDIQQKLPNYEIHMIDTPGMVQDVKNLEGSDFKLIPFKQWREHLDYIASVSLVVNTDFTSTRGRVQVDCAAVGTVGIGSDSDAQVDLYPDYAVDSTVDVETLVNQGVELLTNSITYQSVADQALVKLAFYDYQPSAERLEELIKNTPKR